MEEKWKPITGLDGYEISDHGSCKSLDRIVPYGKKGAITTRKGQLLAPFLVSNNGNRSGALAVSLGRGVRIKIGATVLETFVGPRPEGAIVRHLDDNPYNNHVDNLRWGTYSENMHDMVRNGIHPGAAKTHCKNGHELEQRNDGKGRYCPICARESAKKYKARKRAERRKNR